MSNGKRLPRSTSDMDFFVKVLREVFFKSGQEAEQIMMKVHKEGQASVGVYYFATIF